MTDDTQHKFLDKLARDMAISTDNTVLYKALGWTIVEVPIELWLAVGIGTVLEWATAHCGAHHCWDGKIAFEQGRDATLFRLTWGS